jgi:hypothetical protein
MKPGDKFVRRYPSSNEMKEPVTLIAIYIEEEYVVVYGWYSSTQRGRRIKTQGEYEIGLRNLLCSYVPYVPNKEI